jgi:hypothetical protein
MKKLTTLLLLLGLVMSCSKETAKTPGQVTADEINSVAKQNSITKVVIFIPGYSIGSKPDSFSLDGQYLLSGGRYYNLEKLQVFYVGTATAGGQQVAVLDLYFE